MSLFKSLGKIFKKAVAVVKKVAPVALPIIAPTAYAGTMAAIRNPALAASMIPGIGGFISPLVAAAQARARPTYEPEYEPTYEPSYQQSFMDPTFGGRLPGPDIFAAARPILRGAVSEVTGIDFPEDDGYDDEYDDGYDDDGYDDEYDEEEYYDDEY